MKFDEAYRARGSAFLAADTAQRRACAAFAADIFACISRHPLAAKIPATYYMYQFHDAADEREAMRDISLLFKIFKKMPVPP